MSSFGFGFEQLTNDTALSILTLYPYRHCFKRQLKGQLYTHSTFVLARASNNDGVDFRTDRPALSLEQAIRPPGKVSYAVTAFSPELKAEDTDSATELQPAAFSEVQEEQSQAPAPSFAFSYDEDAEKADIASQIPAAEVPVPSLKTEHAPAFTTGGS